MSTSSREPELIDAMTTDQEPRQHPVMKGLLHGTRPRAVTVETAYRCELWRHGTLIHEDFGQTWRLEVVFEDYSAGGVSGDDEHSFSLIRTQSVTFIPNKS